MPAATDHGDVDVTAVGVAAERRRMGTVRDIILSCVYTVMGCRTLPNKREPCGALGRRADGVIWLGRLFFFFTCPAFVLGIVSGNPLFGRRSCFRASNCTSLGASRSVAGPLGHVKQFGQRSLL